ncbi:MAG: hypothetical protein ABSC48_02375 [Terracidiphilus sp.]|jgi:hypothetical protein
MRVQPTPLSGNPISSRARTLWACAIAALAATALAPVAGQQPLSSPQSPSPASATTAPAPAAGVQSEPKDSQSGKQSSNAVNAEAKKPAVQESEELLKLATSLKAEVDKSTQDTLSLTVVRKAAEIERLAHFVREEAKLEAAANRGGGS